MFKMQSKKRIQFIHGIEEQNLLIHVQSLQCSRKSFLFGTLSFFSISAVLGLSVPFQPLNITRGGSFNLISKGACGGLAI